MLMHARVIPAIMPVQLAVVSSVPSIPTRTALAMASANSALRRANTLHLKIKPNASLLTAVCATLAFSFTSQIVARAERESSSPIASNVNPAQETQRRSPTKPPSAPRRPSGTRSMRLRTRSRPINALVLSNLGTKSSPMNWTSRIALKTLSYNQSRGLSVSHSANQTTKR